MKLNLDFSGLFSPNNMKFDFSNLDMSGFNAKEPVSDPVDIVSNKTPTPDVEVLEGAGTVAVTKTPEVKYSQAVQNAIKSTPDPIEQAIQSVIPQVEIPTIAPQAPTGINIQKTEVPSAIDVDGKYQATNVTGANSFATGFDSGLVGSGSALGDIQQSLIERDIEVNQQLDSFSNDVFTGLGVSKMKSPLFKQSDRFSVQTGTQTVNGVKTPTSVMAVNVTKDFLNTVNNLLSSEQAETYAQQMSGKTSDFFGESSGDFHTDYGALDFVKDLGLTSGNDSFVVQGSNGGYSLFEYNEETNQFEKTLDKEHSFIEGSIPVVARAVQIAALTTMGASALAPYVTTAVNATGLTGATATAVTKGVTNAITQAVITGNVDVKGVALASLSGAVEGANATVETAQANVDNLTKISNSNIAGEALIAQTQLASATAQLSQATATAEVLNNLQTTVDIVQAVEGKDIIKAGDLALSMAGSSTVSSIVKDNLANAGVSADYLDVATSTIIEAADTAIQGGDFKDVVQAGVNNVLIESVVTEDNIRNTFSLDTTGFDDTLTKTLRSLSVEALEGGNREDILVKGLESFIKNLPESDRESPEYLQAVENWWHENIEDPFENWWQTIEPQREVIEQAFGSAVETVKEVGQTAIDMADTAIRAIPPTKEDLEQLVEDTKQTVQEVVDPVYQTARNIEEAGEEFVQGLGDNLPETPTVETPEVTPPSASVSLSADPELTRNEFGYFYDDSALLRNPLLGRSSTTIQDLTSLLQQDAVAKQASSEDKRTRRTKPVYGFNPNISVG
jgi:ElaB/YqjD/DUF883 family membrane-anchored ribosome-binding protein